MIRSTVCSYPPKPSLHAFQCIDHALRVVRGARLLPSGPDAPERKRPERTQNRVTEFATAPYGQTDRRLRLDHAFATRRTGGGRWRAAGVPTVGSCSSAMARRRGVPLPGRSTVRAQNVQVRTEIAYTKPCSTNTSSGPYGRDALRRHPQPRVIESVLLVTTNRIAHVCVTDLLVSVKQCLLQLFRLYRLNPQTRSRSVAVATWTSSNSREAA